MPEVYISDLQGRDLTEEDILRIESGDNNFGDDFRYQRPIKSNAPAEPLSSDEIYRMRKYKLKLADIPEDKLKLSSKKREQKAVEKAQVKE